MADITGPIPPYVSRARAWSNIQPFTYPDGLTYLEMLERMRDYIENVLIPFIREGLDKFADEVVAELQKRLDDVIALVDEATDLVNEAQSLRDDVAAIHDLVVALRDEVIQLVADANDAADRANASADRAEAAAGDALESATAALDALEAMKRTRINVLNFGVVGDGVTDDTEALQSALDYAGSIGGANVIFPSLEYAITYFLDVPANTTITAHGAIVKSVGNTGLLRNFKPGESAKAYSGRSNITILGGRWDANAKNGSVGTVTGTTDAFNFNHGQNITIRDLEIRNTSSAHAIEFNACRDCLVDNVRFVGFMDNSDAGNRWNSEAIQIDAAVNASMPEQDRTICHYITVSNCYMAANGSRANNFGRFIGSHGDDAGISGYGLEHRYIKVVNNTIVNAADTAIRGQVWSNVIVQGNTIISPAADGIAMHTRNNGEQSRVNQIQILDNFIENAGRYAIQLNGTTSYKIEDGEVRGNIVRGGAVQGIFIDNTNNVTVSDNLVDANEAGSGIQLTSCHRGIVANNRVRSNASNGVRLNGSRFVVVEGNNLFLNGGSGIVVDSTGQTSSSNLINGNYIHSPSNNGIAVASSGGRNTISNNEILSAGSTGVAIAVNSTDESVVVGNNASVWPGSTKISNSGGNAIFSYSGSKTIPGNNIV